MPKYEKQKCIHCLEYHNKLTEDHILPKSWYPNSTPIDLEKWTAPSCRKCNEKIGLAENEVFERLAICLDKNELAAMSIHEKFIKKITGIPEDEREQGRLEKRLMDTIKNYVPYPYEEGNKKVAKGFTPKDGVRSKLMIRMPGEKLFTVCEKIIKGLEWKLRGQLIDKDRNLYIITPHEHNKEEMDRVKEWQKIIAPIEKNVHRGPGLIINYGVNQHDNNWVIYHIKIWGHLEIWSMVYPKNRKLTSKKNITKSNELLNNAIKKIKEENTHEALSLIDRSISLDINNFTAHQYKAKFLFDLKKYEDALDAVNKAIELNKNNFATLSLKVSILGLLKKYEECIEFANKSLELRHDDLLILYKKGVSLYYLKKYEEAIEVFNKILKIDPNHLITIEKKISTLALIGRYNDAINLFEASDLPEIDSHYLLNTIGLSFMEIGEYKKANIYLKKAQHINKNEKIIYYNLYRLGLRSKEYKKFLFNWLIFYLLFIKEFFLKKILKKEIRVKKIIKDDRHQLFKGPGRLFSSNAQHRETSAILKLLRTPNLFALCNDTFNWIGVNIPLGLLSNNNFEGDIDIIVSMPKSFPPDENTEPIYRCFETKAILVNKNGVLKSLNKGKHKKLLSQLKKLKKFGSQQIFLLELYVIERGYSRINNFPPKDLIDEIDQKVELLKKSNFGYVMMVDEPAPNVNDEGGGINHIPINILPTKENRPRNPFLELTNHLNDFYEKYTKDKKSNFKGFPIITYCKKCKKLILFGTYDKSKCPNGEHMFY